MISVRRLLAPCICASLVAACVLNPPIAETPRDGVLISRTLVDVARQGGAGQTAGVFVGGAVVQIPLFGPGPKVNWYRHDVKLIGGAMASVVAQGELHKVGDCVRIFEQANGFAQLRITYGFDCKP